MNNNEINFRTPHTVVGTVMEIVVGLLILVQWVVIIYLSQKVDFGTVKTLVLHGVSGTFMPMLMMGLCYCPKTFNIPVRHPRAEHYLLAIQLVRVCCITMMPIFIAAAWETGRPADKAAVELVMIIASCAITIVVAYYTIRLIRMK